MTQQLTIDVLNPDTYGHGDPETSGLPHGQYDHLRDEAPVFRQAMHDPYLVGEVWVVSRHEDVTALSRDNETFSSARGSVNTFKPNPFNCYQVAQVGGMPSMILMDGHEHRRQRKVISPAFTPVTVRAFEAQLREYARDLVQDVVAMHEFDFVDEVATKIPLHSVAELLGVPEEDRPKVLKWAKALSNPTDPHCASSPEEMMEGAQSLGRYALELLGRRRDSRSETDVFSKIASARTADALTDNELMGFFIILCAAGSDTTRAVLSHGLHELMRNPEQMTWLRAHARDIPRAATEELVRWASPVVHMCRTAVRDVELHGQLIGEGESVALLYPAANYDPSAFDEPRRLNLARDPNPHLGFGGGAHICLGRHIAHVEIKVILEELLRRTSEIRPAGEIEYVREAWMRGVRALPVEVQPA
jgi:cholest-4-en-3-one 26-monooxygenase